MRRVVRAGAAGALLALLLGACGDDAGPETLPSPDDDNGTGTGTDDSGAGIAWPGDGGPAEVVPLGEGLAAELPESWEVEPFEERDPSETPYLEEGCTVLSGRLITGDGRLTLELNPAGCDVHQANVGNGYHGIYTSLEDVEDPMDVEETEVPAGSLTTFTQNYYECTNECTDYEDNVGLLELDGPPDPGRPTLMLLDPRSELPMEGLVAVAGAVSVE